MRAVLFAPLFAFCLAAGLSGFSGPVAAMDCPEPQSHDADGILAESEGQVRELAQLMGTGDEENRIREIVNALKEQNPDVSQEEIVNYMTAVFCTEVAGNDGLSDAEKAARIEAFDSQVMAIE
ncbi:MAG: hypothetical protein AAF530_23840 [Pseudomonadota bacterium]